MNQVITPIKIGNVSVFEPPISNTIPLKEVSLYDIFTVIKSQKLAETTNELRSATPGEAKEIKLKKLHYCTPNGTFSKRANTALKQASNLLVIDLDNLEPDELANIKAEIVSDFEPVLMFISPSGRGLKIIYYIDLTVGSHLQYFHALREYFSQRLNLEIDESGKDVARACFLCHDPDAFYSETPTVLRREFLDTFHVDESPKQTVQQTPSPISENEIIRRMDTWCHKNFTYVKGNRNNFITQLSGALHRAGVSEFDALNHCRGYAESDFTQKEIETTVRSIYRNSAFSGKNPLHQEREVTSFKGEVTSHMPRITGETEDFKKVVTGNLVTTQKFKIPEFPVDAFPEKVRNIILTLNEKQGFPVDFSAAAVLFACAVCSGNNYSLKIKNGWSEKPILYIVIVGKRGTMKTHPVNWYLKPIHERDGEKHKQFERAEAIYKENMELPRDERESIEQPILTQTLLSDYTIEAINEAHQNNPKGLGVHRDEVAGLVNDFNKYTGGRGSEQQVLLSNHSALPIIVNRRGQKPIRVNNPCISIIGGIQPEILSELSAGSRLETGFLDRINFFFPDNLKKPKFNESDIPAKLLEDWKNIILPLLDQSNEHSREINFSKDAKNLFVEWFNLNTDLVNAGDVSSSKLDMILARVALVLHLLDGKTGDISVKTLSGAIKIIEYFRETAKKVHAHLNTEPAININQHVAKILTAKGMSSREVGKILDVSHVAVLKMLKK